MTKRQIGLTLATLFIFICWFYPSYSESSPIKAKLTMTDSQHFEQFARCARLAYGSGDKSAYKRNLRAANIYAARIKAKGGGTSLAYQAGFVDGNVSQIVRYNKGKYTRRDVAKAMYKNSCSEIM